MLRCSWNRGVGMSEKNDIFFIMKNVVPMVVKVALVPFLINVTLGILHGSLWGAITIVQQYFFDTVNAYISNKESIKDIIVALSIMAGAYLLVHVLNGVENCNSDLLKGFINGRLSKNIHLKIAKLSADCFENPYYLNDMNKASEGKKNAVNFVFTLKDILCFYIPYFTVMTWYLFRLKPILALSTALVFFPTIFTHVAKTRVGSELEEKTAPIRRENKYYEDCLTSREYLKETRMLGAFGYFKKLYTETLNILNKIKYKADIKTCKVEIVLKMVTVIGYCSILWMLFVALLNNEITVGAFSAVFYSISTLYTIMEEVIFYEIGEMSRDYGTIINLIGFMLLEEREGTDMEVEWGDIILDDVSYSYPMAKEPVIKNVSFTWKKGETIAIVGENGAGKSTLVKLLTGLYLPKIGNAYIGDINCRDISNKSLFQNKSAVFQNYQRYQMTLKNNIMISELSDRKLEPNLDCICESAGLDISSKEFQNGYDTMLSKEFGGVDLSGGFWQRIAISRALYRISNYIVLDEPTSAIDPLEEARIYENFAKIIKGKSALIVTHRLGSVKLADRIVVLKKGKIVESGTHSELMELEGEYNRLYKMQQQLYI